MIRMPILLVSVVASASLTGTALAAPFGQHVSSCAHQLGAREGAPGTTCAHDGMTMTFPNFGSMVEHMATMHGR